MLNESADVELQSKDLSSHIFPSDEMKQRLVQFITISIEAKPVNNFYCDWMTEYC